MMTLTWKELSRKRDPRTKKWRLYETVKSMSFEDAMGFKKALEALSTNPAISDIKQS